MALVMRRLWSFYRHKDYLQAGRAVSEFVLGVIYLIDAVHPLAVIDRIVLIRNSIILIFLIELFYQYYILPKMRRVAKDGII